MNNYTNIKVIGFDLDGTILNTLQDLTNAVNYGLEKFNYPKRTIMEIMSFIGNGVNKLIERSLPNSIKNENYDNVLKEFRNYYLNHYYDFTVPYDGVKETLIRLKEAGFVLALMTNKLEVVAKDLIERFYPSLFDIVIGDDPIRNKKPALDYANILFKKCHVTGNEVLYIGDTNVDYEFAKNAKMNLLLVDYGYRKQSDLKAFNEAKVISHPYEILSLLDLKGRKLHFSRLNNARDFNNLKGFEGKMIKPFRIIRSENLSHLTEEDQNKLFKQLNVKVVIDFRDKDEIIGREDKLIEGVKYYNIPLLPDNDKLEAVARKYQNGKLSYQDKLELMYKQDPNFSPYTLMAENYTTLLTHPYSLKGYKKFLDIVKNNKEGAILFHCAGGKDRAGVAALLIELILSVDILDIKKDYLLTNSNYEPNLKYTLDKVDKINHPHLTDILKATILAYPLYFDYAISAIEEKYKNHLDYIKNTFDYNDEDIEDFRNNYLF